MGKDVPNEEAGGVGMKIGLEIHVQLPTRSKMFCSCPSTGAEGPNEHICPGCMGMPGTRPSLNKAAVEIGIKLARLLNCTVPDVIWFNRKIYFYPDLCRHYQITQYETPIGRNGVYHLGKKPIGITEAHLEEDPGSMTKSGDGALIDYNRSGMPLVEIVTDPDISSPAEAREFLTSLLKDIRHVIDLPDDGERSIRCDCNISVGKERCEVKNVSGLKNVERALTYEAVRQTKVLQSGGKIVRETRHYDEERKVTTAARKKEFAGDYAYVLEPNLGVINVKGIAGDIVTKESPQGMVSRFQKEFGIEEKMAKQIINTSMKLAELFEHIARKADTENAVKWVAGPISSNWKILESQMPGRTDGLTDIIIQYKNKMINDVECSMRLKAFITGGTLSDMEKNGADLDALIRKAVSDNPSVIDDYRKNEKAANRVIGAVMKQTGGAYSSSDIVEATKRILDEML
ncbi:MAG: Asp-tRNA(Asn)/Glu-tRNA(Gln) amidotransferase subunit GatB [Methanomassiliicoccaceae archaeon]|jgi:aspartyl-tRNA(Asn)/glutamyl-tRNA(Gln) amidotransferase subunit B|nr:Asp-tRNA(Asn)/Glu-tRNA(Gln) amidotransferase subunit GatB [Methanomassiliicoccaceae archaeon]